MIMKISRDLYHWNIDLVMFRFMFRYKLKKHYSVSQHNQYQCITLFIIISLLSLPVPPQPLAISSTANEIDKVSKPEPP